MATALRWIGGILGWPLVTAALLWGSVHLHVPTAMGRAAARSGINELASRKLAGRLHVDSVDALSLDHIAVSGFTAFDPDGVEVIAARHAELRIDLRALLGGTLKMRDMQAYDGAVAIREGSSGAISIEQTFASASGSSGGGKPLNIDLGWIWAENVRLDIQMVGRPLVFRVATASMHVERRGDAPVQIDLRDVDGAMNRPAPLDVAIRFVGARATIRPKTDQVLDLYSGICLGEEALQTRVIYRPGPPKVARIVIDYESGLGFLASVGLRIGGLFSGPLTVDEAELPGEPPECEGPALEPESESESE